MSTHEVGEDTALIAHSRKDHWGNAYVDIRDLRPGPAPIPGFFTGGVSLVELTVTQARALATAILAACDGPTELED